MLDGISNALVLFSDPIFLTFYANWRTGAQTVIQQGRRQEQPAGVPLGYVKDLVEAENAVGDRFERHARRKW
jgi:hypothetical protein